MARRQRIAPKLVKCPGKFVKVIIASVREEKALSKPKFDLRDRLIRIRFERDTALCEHFNRDVGLLDLNFEK